MELDCVRSPLHHGRFVDEFMSCTHEALAEHEML